MQLKFADKDAQDFASSLDLTQCATVAAPRGLYADVLPMFLPNQSATVGNIVQAFELTEQSMQQGQRQDVTVVMFSGHGFQIGGSLYLLPYGVDSSSSAQIEATAIPIAQFQNLVGRLAANGQVVVFIDACHSGAAASDGTALVPDASGLATITPDAKTVVLTSSTGAETSYEDPAWQHGAVTKVLLGALGPSAAGLHAVSMAELATFMKPQLLSAVSSASAPKRGSPPPGVPAAPEAARQNSPTTTSGAAQLDALTAGKRGGNAVEERVDGLLDLVLLQTRAGFCQFLNELGLCHRRPDLKDSHRLLPPGRCNRHQIVSRRRLRENRR